MTKKKTKTKDEVSEQLAEIYKNEDGSLPDMTNFQKRKSLRTLRAFFTLLFACLFLGVVILAGIFFLKPKNQFSKEQVTVAVTGEENITSGQVTHYRIRYYNGESVPVTKAKLVVNYPEGFVFKESSVPASNDKNTEWDLGTLSSLQNGFIDVYGTLSGDLGVEESLRVFLNYTPANFSSEFQAVGVAKVTIGESPVALSITAPSTTAIGTPVSLIFTLTPRDPSTTLQDLSLSIDPGPGFIQKTSSPPSDNFGAWVWTLASFKGEKSITVVGTFSPNSGITDYTLHAKVMGSLGTTTSKKSFIFDQKDYHVTFEDTKMSADFTINGAHDALTVSPGDVLATVFTIKNNFATPLQNVKASVTFDAPSFQDKSILNWAKVDDKNKDTITGVQVGTDIRRGMISWDKTMVGGLQSIAPSTQFSLNFGLPLKTAGEASLSNFKENTIHATLEIQYDVEGKKQVFVSSPIEIVLNSDLSLQSSFQKQKNENSLDQFVFTWDILNSVHEIQNAQIEAEIYGDIEWQPELLTLPFGNMTFDSKTKKITWKADKIPAISNIQQIKFSFLRKNYNPTQTQLVSKVQLTGKDSVTGKNVTILVSPTANTL